MNPFNNEMSTYKYMMTSLLRHLLHVLTYMLYLPRQTDRHIMHACIHACTRSTLCYKTRYLIQDSVSMCNNNNNK